MRLLATLGPKGQMCLPSTIRRALGLGPGGHVGFRRLETGEFVIKAVPADAIESLEPSQFNLDRVALDEADLQRLTREDRAARGLQALRGGDFDDFA